MALIPVCCNPSEAPSDYVSSCITGAEVPHRQHKFQSHRKILDDTVRRKGSKIFRLRFGDLKIRVKLMILHNLFFVVLGFAVYYALFPQLEAMPPSARWNLVLALAAVYLLAVLALELLILPRYVYGPLRRLLEADRATQSGDEKHEYIDDEHIFRDELGQIMRSRNATIRKLRSHEEELMRKNELLERQDRLASLGLLAASVAHELNTPLSVLYGSIEKLLEKEQSPQMRERLERMLRVTQRLRRISEGLTGFARGGQRTIGLVELRGIVEEAWALLAMDGKSAAVQFQNGVPESLYVTGDGDRLVQVFVNLLRNALDAVSANGHIVVQARKTETGQVQITVEDDGPGIAPAMLAGVFEAFVSNRLDAKGTGLGLTIAEGIIVQHGGTITARNRPESGACVEIRLPVADTQDRRGHHL